MDGPRDYETKRSTSDRERQIYDITYMWNLKYDTNEYNKTQIHKYREQTGGYQRGEGRRVGQDRGRGSRDTNYYV